MSHVCRELPWVVELFEVDSQYIALALDNIFICETMQIVKDESMFSTNIDQHNHGIP